MAASFKPCPECGGERIEAEIANVFSLQQKDKFVPKTSSVGVLVCTNCGFLAFYAFDPKNLIIKRPDKPIDK